MRQGQRPHVERIAPDKAEWIARQALERCCRMEASEGTGDRRMIGADGTVMRSHFGLGPVLPTSTCSPNMGRLPGFGRPCEHAISFAERVLGDTVAHAHAGGNGCRP